MNVNSQDKTGATILHYAIAHGQFEIVEYLLQIYNDTISLKIKDNNQWTPIALSVYLATVAKFNKGYLFFCCLFCFVLFCFLVCNVRDGGVWFTAIACGCMCVCFFVYAWWFKYINQP